MLRPLVPRYVAWLDAHLAIVLGIAAALAVVCAALAARLPLRSDLSTLLPASQRSVQDLRAIQARARPFGTVHIAIEAPDPAVRERAGAAVRTQLAELARRSPERIVAYSPDDSALHRYAWEHRFVLAPLADLEAARDALRARIERAKLAANPLFIDLDDAPPPAADRLNELAERVTELERKAAGGPRVSRDGTLELLVVQTAFAGSEIARTRALMAEIDAVLEAVARQVPGARLGVTGNAPTTLAEHDSVLEGMTLSIAITIALCAIALWLYYRSGRLVIAMLAALTVGVVATFAFALAAIGHLDMMSAFLAAIVIGNGVNPALILVARYLEEVRGGARAAAAVAPAIAGALHGTLAAAATAAVAYISLLVSDFLGFRHFGAIACAGMVFTWLATFTVLPALLLALARRGAVRPTPSPAVGRVLAALLPRRHGRTVAVGAAITAAAALITAHFIATDPFTKDWRDLQSSTPAIREARALDARLRAAFEGGSQLAGQAYQVVIAVDHREQLAPALEAIRAAHAALPPARRWLHDVRSIADLVPPDQAAKLAVLHQLRQLLDDDVLVASLDPAERAPLARLRPPEAVRAVTDADVPRELAWPFIERDGSVGRLAIVRGAGLDSFDVDDRLRFAHEIRALPLPPGTLAASESLIIADIVETMERDAPWMVLIALGGSIAAVLAVLGVGRHAAGSLACGLAGVIVMIALCAISGLRVHFLDLIALPITIGIGVDYAVNLAVRDRQEGERGPRHLLATTGGAVLLCSYTTTVGYGTLLLSANGGIRAFGLAALLGELACIAMALLIGPALFALLRERRARRS